MVRKKVVDLRLQMTEMNSSTSSHLNRQVEKQNKLQLEKYVSSK